MIQKKILTVTNTKYFAPALSNRSSQALELNLVAVKLAMKSSYTMFYVGMVSTITFNTEIRDNVLGRSFEGDDSIQDYSNLVGYGGSN